MPLAPPAGIFNETFSILNVTQGFLLFHFLKVNKTWV